MKTAADYPDGDEAAILRGTENPIPAFKKGWPAYMRVPQSIGYHYLGIKTARGFQILGATFALAGALGVNWLLFKRFNLSPANAVFAASLFNLALIANTEMQKWATFAIPLYPLRILSGSLFIASLAYFTDPGTGIRWRVALSLGVLLVPVTLMHPILVIPWFAVVVAIAVTDVVRGESSRRSIRRWLAQALCLLALPGTAGALVVLIAPHSEMRVPRDNIQQWYFFLNDAYPKTAEGLAHFVFVDLKLLLFNVCLPRELVHWAEIHVLLGTLPLAVCIVGTIISLFRPRELRFALAIYVLVDLTLRLGANLSGAFPFGGLERYALSLVFALAVLAILGVLDLATAAGWLLSRAGKLGDAVARCLVPAATAIVLGLAVWLGVRLDIATTGETASILTDVREIRANYATLTGEMIVVEDTTYAVLYYYLGSTLEDHNEMLSIPKMYIPRDISQGQLADLKKRIATRSSVRTVTRLEFNEPYFREAYRAVDERFDEQSRRKLLNFYFATWTLPGHESPAAKP